MPWLQRIALTLLAFGFAGLGLMAWQPSSLATAPEERSSYALAISSGDLLLLEPRHPHAPEQTDRLSCERVFRIGTVAIGASCIAHARQVVAGD